MKVLIISGMIIVFISAFFVFFVADKVLSSYADCRQDIISGKTVCIVSETSTLIVIGMLLAGGFAVVCLFVAYLLISTVTSKRSMCFSSTMQKRLTK